MVLLKNQVMWDVTLFSSK